MPGKGWGVQNRKGWEGSSQALPLQMGGRKNCFYAEGRGTNRSEVVLT